jgi:hypothetical protein
MRLIPLSLLLSASAAGGFAAENMLGRQSQNEGLPVLPAPAGGVAVDGDLTEWDWSSRIWCFADLGVRARYSAEVAGMWDADAVYLAARWRDPTPMHSAVDPNHNPGDGWKSDAMQMRIRTGDQTTWVTTWFFAGKRQPVMSVDRWKDMNNARSGTVGTLMVGAEGKSELEQGAALSFRADADGRGFVQEMRIPWAMLSQKPGPLKAGEVFRLGLEFLWGDPTGGLAYPVHRYADNMQPGATSREFFWDNWRGWGDATLLPAGPVVQRRYLPDGGLIAGTVPVRAQVPADAARFTLVIEDQQGRRIRNLAADCEPVDYGKDATGGSRTVEVLWDCLDDAGRPVEPGAYRVRGLSHGGLSAEYGMCFYNPGSPAWATVDGRGAWGADHHPPSGVAAGGDLTVVSWVFAEGGSGIIGIGPDGKKKWSQYRGANLIAADAESVYAFQCEGWYTAGTKADYLCRYRLKDGTPHTFTVAGKERPLDLPLHQVLGLDKPVQATGLAVAKGRLAIALAHGEIVVLDAGTLAVQRRFPAKDPGVLTWGADGVLYAVLGQPAPAAAAMFNDGHAAVETPWTGVVNRLDPATGAATPLALTGLGRIAGLTVDREGNLVVADSGPDSQVKAFSADGRPVYTCGRKGGRPIRGAFDEQAMMRISAVAVDARGEVWVPESWAYPRRVSVWKRDGGLARDYVGNTEYSGAGCYLHDQKPGLAYCGPVELAIDPATRSWKVRSILWVPDPAKGERFDISAGNATPTRFTSSASGSAREYLYERGESGPHVLFMETAQGWKPVAAVCLAAQMLDLLGANRGHLTPVAQPSGEWAGLDAGDGVFWNDGNEDGIPQRGECTIVPATAKSVVGKRIIGGGLVLTAGWGGRIGSDLSFYTTRSGSGEVVGYRPLRFTPAGAPVYGPEGMTTLATIDGGKRIGVVETTPLPGEKTLVVLPTNYWDFSKPATFVGLDLETGAVRWSYPSLYGGVHGSHNAPMPRPGVMIGQLKCCGSAQMDGDIGSVLLMRGNLGQDFLITSDGLCVGTLFMDTRFPRESLPDTEAALVGRPMEGFSEGSEPFNGWFGRQSDGKVRQVNGMPGQAAMVQEIKGLEGIRRFTAEPVTVDAAIIARAVAEARARLAAAAAAKAGRIVRSAQPLACDGSGAGWDALKAGALKIVREGQPDSAEARLACDDQNLYVRWDVKDASPWKNAASDLGRLFKTGDCVDLCLRTDPAAKGDQPVAGDLRVVIGPGANGKPVAVLMRPVEAGAPAEVARSYTSPVGTKNFARVAPLAGARLGVQKLPGGYRVEAALPLAVLGLSTKAGSTLRGDVGFVSSDPQGTSNTARTCWSNQDTNLVSDLPLEAWLYPARWSELRVE